MAGFNELARETVKVQITTGSANPLPTKQFVKIAETTLNVKVGQPSGLPSGYPGSIVLSPGENSGEWLLIAGAGIGLALAVAGGKKHV